MDRIKIVVPEKMIFRRYCPLKSGWGQHLRLSCMLLIALGVDSFENLWACRSCQLMILSFLGERKNIFKFGDFPLWQYLGEFGLNTNYTIDRVSTPGAIVRSKGHPVDLVCGYRSPSFLILDCSFDWLFFFFFFSPFYMWDISLLFVHSESEI